MATPHLGILLPTEEHLGSSKILVILNNAAINRLFCEREFVPLGKISVYYMEGVKCLTF